MCRAKPTCTELGDPATWSRRAPLEIPGELRDRIDDLLSAIAFAARSEREAATRALAELPDRDARQWAVEHGQMSGIHRNSVLRRPPAGRANNSSTPRSVSKPLGRTVLTRDKYQCRYCGLRVVPREILKAFSAVVGADRFPFGNTNETRHGMAILVIAQVDHVVPYQQGGPTHIDNLVAACWACNYGKDRFTLEQLGLDDPRATPASVLPFDGLVGLHHALSKQN